MLILLKFPLFLRSHSLISFCAEWNLSWLLCRPLLSECGGVGRKSRGFKVDLFCLFISLKATRKGKLKINYAVILRKYSRIHKVLSFVIESAQRCPTFSAQASQLESSSGQFSGWTNEISSQRISTNVSTLLAFKYLLFDRVDVKLKLISGLNKKKRDWSKPEPIYGE